VVSSLIEEQLNRLPNSPGVYLMRDAEGNILYVGKAASLHHRVRSYFSAGQKLSPKIQRMVARVADIDFFIAASEQEALILELNLIKQYHPRYNVRLKDDKTFPYLKIDTNEECRISFPFASVLKPSPARLPGPALNIIWGAAWLPVLAPSIMRNMTKSSMR
jgi:excinuclease ABC subunit C